MAFGPQEGAGRASQSLAPSCRVQHGAVEPVLLQPAPARLSGREITVAILADRQPAHRNRQFLARINSLPIDWSSQRGMLGLACSGQAPQDRRLAPYPYGGGEPGPAQHWQGESGHQLEQCQQDRAIEAKVLQWFLDRTENIKMQEENREHGLGNQMNDLNQRARQCHALPPYYRQQDCVHPQGPRQAGVADRPWSLPPAAPR